MEKYTISLEGHLTSYVFYNKVLRELHDYYANDGKSQLVFDFSKINTIDPLVIPNLLCIGYIIKNNSDMPPYFYMPDNYDLRYVKSYINNINFISIAEKFGLFEFNYEVKCGLIESNMDELNTTLYFLKNEDEKTSWIKLTEHINDFAQKYLRDFDMLDAYGKNNYIIEICKELVENSKKHGQSFSFLTMQYNYKREKVFISISDCGLGFKSTINRQIAQKALENQLKDGMLDSEIDGIIQGIYSRSNSKVYGLYNVIRKIMDKLGTVRIHSVDTQLILTDRMSFPMDVAGNKTDLLSIVKSDIFKKNIRNDLKYGGVHIELEIPIVLANRRGEI